VPDVGREAGSPDPRKVGPGYALGRLSSGVVLLGCVRSAASIWPAAAPLWLEVVPRRTRTMDCKWVAKPTGAAPPPRAAALCNSCDKAISFADGRDDDACVRDARIDKCCTQNY
jgi:hypothetical protein